ncbi:glycosyltransferase family 2 protein [Cellulomonas wangsupingiae]|uniref:Glycosyltransferase family 2 protein n=1 Tax=Cellulomonas wangsupingiae TaxID=2968085 RepID=A0ABY5K1P6_9CELL|nr:glycosyltransferase family 2 protein [Cellulomonas wangsupingiae]MCC2335695.1 glycosyltransferase family 2 protein [Cellulomonas wangsupingiae]MCM0640326.1 glycosyltransferase family 2 protein [Cellulomonas wangsupingiae]UUI63930.1 glycosyltransferase family 2 protein [Cellulomonas wangsupingiae]
MPQTLVLVPAYNEAENLRVLLPRILAQGPAVAGGLAVLVIDDGSHDDTADVVREVSPGPEVLRVTSLRVNRGKSEALRVGFREAVATGATTVVMMDADGQDDPSELPRLVERLGEGVDLVTGARTVRNDRFVKRHTSRLYNRTTSALARVPGTDFNSGFKAMRSDVVAELAPMMYGEMHRYLTVMAHWKGFRTSEVPVQHHARMHGTTKYGPARFWRGFMDLLTVRFLLSYENRPSHLFGGIGAAGLGLGGLMLLYLLALRLSGATVGDRPMLLAAVLLVLGGLQFFLFGLSAELGVRHRNGRRADEAAADAGSEA